MGDQRMNRIIGHSARIGLTALLGVILAAALITDPSAWAADKGTTAKSTAPTKTADKEILETLAAGATDRNPFAYEEDQTLKAQDEHSKYPDYFDLRNADGYGKSYVTPVRVQNPFGTCWGFAAVASAESSILGDEELNKGLDPKTIDLSEKHLAWFTASHIDDPDNPQNGEGMHFNKDTAVSHYNTGGFQRFATLCFASGIGPMLEAVFPYRGENGDVASWRVATAYDKNDKPLKYEYKDVWYSDDDDWSLPESVRFGNEYRLEDSFILPSPSDETESGEYVFSEAGVEAIKEQLVDHHRAVSICFTAESYIPGQDTSGKLYMSENWAHYTWEKEMANHAVTVVGWDDNYPKENFLEGHQPPGDGAFLIKNSWGSELNDFPNNGYRHWGLLEGKDGIPYDKNAKATSDRATGYFWLSYYDQSLDSVEAFDFEKPNDEFGYYVEQNDYLIMGDIDMNETPKTKTANVFQTEATSELSGISVMTTVPETDVSYEIYLLRGGYESPTDGIKLTEGTAHYKYGGYHHIDLEPSQQSILAKGQNYSVIVSETTGSGKAYFPCSSGFKKGSRMSEVFEGYMEAVVNPGESFLHFSDKWYDLSDADVQNAILGEKGKDYAMDNFLIKSYLEPVVMGGKEFKGYLKVSNWSQGAPGTFSFQSGDEPLSIAAEFRGTKAGDPPVQANITWSSSDPSVFTVEPKMNNHSQATLTPVGAGTAYLTADAGDYGRRVVGVQVSGEDPTIVPGCKITSLTVKGNKKLRVKVKSMKTSSLTGYKISYRAVGSSKWTTKSMAASKNAKVLNGLKKGKKYQVRVRGYVKSGGNINYGAWSKVKTSGKIR